MSFNVIVLREFSLPLGTHLLGPDTSRQKTRNTYALCLVNSETFSILYPPVDRNKLLAPAFSFGCADDAENLHVKGSRSEKATLCCTHPWASVLYITYFECWVNAWIWLTTCKPLNFFFFFFYPFVWGVNLPNPAPLLRGACAARLAPLQTYHDSLGFAKPNLMKCKTN